VPNHAPLWQLRDFEYHADIWINTEDPDQILINEVFEWILSRMEDPVGAENSIRAVQAACSYSWRRPPR
jgi:hypothetical protein